MRKGLLLLAFLMLTPALVLAQGTPEWDLQGEFWPAELVGISQPSGHGIAVDGLDRVWFQPYYATDSVAVAENGGAYSPVRVIYVYNQDGTYVDRVKFVDLPGGGTDTLGGFWNGTAWEGNSGRGLRADANGNILVAVFNSLYYLDHTSVGDGDEVATALTPKRTFPDYCGMSAPAYAAETGNVFVGSVCSGNPASPQELSGQDLSDLSVVAGESRGFSRSFEVTPDGNTVIWAGYTNHAIILYQRPDEFSPWDSVGTVLRGMDSESITINAATGNIWVAAGSPNDTPNRYTLPDGTPVVSNWNSNTWYEFALADVVDGDAVETPLATITWAECQTFALGVCVENSGRPRGIAFSLDGKTAYATQFSQGEPAIYQYTEPGATSIDQIDGTIPERYTLSQNYPNPFNPSTTIEFSLTEAAHARLSVYDMMGREVAVLVDQAMIPGTYKATFNAANLSSGVYMYRLDVGAEQLTGLMTLLK